MSGSQALRVFHFSFTLQNLVVQCCAHNRETIFDAGCNECPEQTRTTELVRYPKTTVSEGAECVNVTAACVENAVPLSPSLEVTCCSGGVWRVNEELRCKKNYKATDAGNCISKSLAFPFLPHSVNILFKKKLI